MATVTGIGGVFFKSTKDHKRLADELWEPMAWDEKNETQ